MSDKLTTFEYRTVKGLQTLIVPLRNSGIVSAQLWVNTGGATESPYEGSGISHLIEHLIFHGCKLTPQVDVRSYIHSLGGIIGAYTQAYHTVFCIDGIAQYAEQFVRTLMRMVKYPLFPAYRFESEKIIIRNEMNMLQDHPAEKLYFLLIETIYKKSPRKYHSIGNPKLFERLTYDDMLHYYHSRYTAGNMMLCIVGDISYHDFIEWVESESSDMAVTEPYIIPHATMEEPALMAQRYCEIYHHGKSDSLHIAWPVPDIGHRDNAAFTIFNTMFASGRHSQIQTFFDTREHKNFKLQSKFMGDMGIFCISMHTEPGSLPLIKDAFIDYVTSLKKQDWSSSLEPAKNLFRTSLLRLQDSPRNYATTLSRLWLHTHNSDCIEEWKAAVGGVSSRDIEFIINNYLNPARCVQICMLALPHHDKSKIFPKKIYEPHENLLNERLLSNGTKIAFIRRRGEPLVYVTFAFIAGCLLETEHTAGINKLMLRCMIQQENVSGLIAQIEAKGGRVNHVVGNNTLTISGYAYPEDFELLVLAITSIFINSDFSDTLISQQIERSHHLMNTPQEPSFYVLAHIKRAMFGAASLGNPLEGTHDSLANINKELLTQQYNKIFCGKNMSISVIGDLEFDSIERTIASHLSFLRQGERIQRPKALIPRSATISYPHEGKQAFVALGLPLDSFADVCHCAQMIIIEWLRDNTGPLFVNIRENKSLAYYIQVNEIFGWSNGCLIFLIGTQSVHKHKVKNILGSIIRDIRISGISSEDLQRVKNKILTNRRFYEFDKAKLCEGIAFNLLFGFNPNYNAVLQQEIMQITREQVNDSLLRLFDENSAQVWYCSE